MRSIVTVFHRRRRYMGRHGGTSNHPKQHESRGMTVLPLERITADCVAPMEAEPSIEGRPPGEQERQPRGQVARPKRARGSGRPETG